MMYLSPFPAAIPPIPSDPWEAARWRETSRRRRLLDGLWHQDLLDRLQQRLGSVRRAAWGEPSQTVNPFRDLCRELAVLYDAPPEIRHDYGDISPLVESIRLSGLWGLMQRVQRYCIGLREMLVRVHRTDTGALVYRPVYPDNVLVDASSDRPDIPLSVRELRLRTAPNGNSSLWTLDVLDIRDANAPVYRVTAIKDGLSEGEDLSEYYLGGNFSGDAYPYRRVDGRPVLPYVLYHASQLGDRTWDPWESIELVDATLDLAVDANMIQHVFRDASWPQRYAVNLRPAGGNIATELSGEGRRQEIVTDPASLLILESQDVEGQGQPMVGQWQPGGDLSTMEEALDLELARLLTAAGVPPSDVQRLGGTARSGAAIALTNEGKRAAQRRYASQFRAGDERLVALSAILINRAVGSTVWPEWGYSIVYKEIPLSPDELEARRKHVLELLEAGLISRIDAYRQLNPGLSAIQAQLDIQSIDAQGATQKGNEV